MRKFILTVTLLILAQTAGAESKTRNFLACQSANVAWLPLTRLLVKKNIEQGDLIMHMHRFTGNGEQFTTEPASLLSGAGAAQFVLRSESFTLEVGQGDPKELSAQLFTNVGGSIDKRGVEALECSLLNQ